MQLYKITQEDFYRDARSEYQKTRALVKRHGTQYRLVYNACDMTFSSRPYYVGLKKYDHVITILYAYGPHKKEIDQAALESAFLNVDNALDYAQ